MRIGPFGLPEILLILAILLLIFGARRLPEIGASLGKGIRSFKSTVTGEDETKAEASAAATSTANPPSANHAAPASRVGSDNP